MQSGLNSFKSKEGKLHVDKLKPIPSDLNKLSDVFEQEVVKMYDALVNCLFGATNTKKGQQ